MRIENSLGAMPHSTCMLSQPSEVGPIQEWDTDAGGLYQLACSFCVIEPGL